MIYEIKQKMLTGFVFLLSIAFCLEAAASDELRFNPFERPDMESDAQLTKRGNAAGNELKLRGTVIDGADSLANIGGDFYRMDQEVSGYRVTKIENGRVILRRGSNETVLTLHDDEQKDKRRR